ASTVALSPASDSGSVIVSGWLGAEVRTNECSYPVGGARRTRSTPGMTAAYVAVSTAVVGGGRGSGHSRSNDFVPTSRLAAVLSPPSENMTSAVVAAGWNPSAVASRVVSIGVQPEGSVSSGTRTGPEAMSVEKVPSGLAQVSLVSVVS